MQRGQPAPTPAAPTWEDRPLDDYIVPSLPPDWQPPAFLTEEVPTSESEASEEEEVKDAIIMQAFLACFTYADLSCRPPPEE